MSKRVSNKRYFLLLSYRNLFVSGFDTGRILAYSIFVVLVISPMHERLITRESWCCQLEKCKHKQVGNTSLLIYYRSIDLK